MAIAFVFELDDFDKDRYDRFMEAIGRSEVTTDLPAGAIAHFAGPTGAGWRLIDVWEDEASAVAFYTVARAAFTGGSDMPPISSKQWPLHRVEMAGPHASSPRN